MFRTAWLAALVACVASGIQVDAAVVKRVVRVEGEGKNLLKDDGWRASDKGFERQGGELVCDNGGDAAGVRGASQTVALNQTSPQPIVASVWSKSENVGGGRNSDYSLYIDLTYVDGGTLWGQVGMFSPGSHDWERREVRIVPERAVRSVSVNLLLRRHSGKAYFKDARLQQLDTPAGAASFDGMPVIVGNAASGLAVRDVAGDSDFVSFENGEALGLKLTDQVSKQGRATFHNVKISDASGRDRAITLVYTSIVAGDGWRWLVDPRREEATQSPREYRNNSGSGRISRNPLAAVSKGGEGHAIALDMGQPAVFRVGYAAGTKELYIAYDIGLAKEKNSAELRFCSFDFDAAWGFRGAVAGMYEAFPDYFRCRTPQQGIWMPFAKISAVEGWEDFGFKFKEGDNEVAWDDAHGVTTFRYTEPLTWWMSMPKAMPRTMEAAVAEAKRLAAAGRKEAQALLNSGYHDEQGRFVAQMQNTPWSDGAVWSMNSSPAVAGEVTDFKNKWNPALRDRLYGPGKKADLDGEYIDSAEGYVTAELDFRRDHLATSQTPLTFSTDSNRPALLRGLITFEYIRGIERDIHGMNKLMMANSTPDRICWLTPLLDVMGTETDWNPGGRWRPMPDRDLLYRRVLCGPKPYCFLMNSNFDRFPYEATERFMKRSLAYGMFPGFFSANASTGHYFSRKDLYNRDRPLFKKYVPLCKAVAEAGWQPVTLARSSDEKVYVERFGRQYLTVFNDSPEKRTATITLGGVQSGGEKDLVSGGSIAWRDGKMQIELAPEDVAVIEIR